MKDDKANKMQCSIETKKGESARKKANHNIAQIRKKNISQKKRLSLLFKKMFNAPLKLL